MTTFLRGARIASHRLSSSSRFASTLVMATVDPSGLTAATLSTITASWQLAETCTVLVCGSTEAAAEAASIAGVARVLHSDTERPAASAIAQLAAGFSHVLVPSGNFMKDFAPRVAASMDVSPVTEVVEIVDESTFIRPMYAGNALATVRVGGKGPSLLTIRATAFEKAALGGGTGAVEKIDVETAQTAATFVSASAPSSERPDLTSANVVISGGRGMKSGENFAMLEAMADTFNGRAAVGASRAAVDAGMVPNEYQVGQTGKVVAPDLYVAVGISGAIQHLSGMKDSKTIVAINKDPEAPIFQVADYGLVEDLFEAVPKLNEQITQAAAASS